MAASAHPNAPLLAAMQPTKRPFRADVTQKQTPLCSGEDGGGVMMKVAAGCGDGDVGGCSGGDAAVVAAVVAMGVAVDDGSGGAWLEMGVVPSSVWWCAAAAAAVVDGGDGGGGEDSGGEGDVVFDGARLFGWLWRSVALVSMVDVFGGGVLMMMWVGGGVSALLVGAWVGDDDVGGGGCGCRRRVQSAMEVHGGDAQFVDDEEILKALLELIKLSDEDDEKVLQCPVWGCDRLVSRAKVIENQRMSATRQGMSSAEIDQIVAQRVTDAIEAIAIYETKIRMTHDPMNQVIRQETTIEKNANNKRKFENQPKDNRVPQQPPFKKPDVERAYTIGANGKKAYAGNLPY
ncbi:hypothetical protein Tco_0764605 [Tanacetum coccineum]